ncbi:Endoplasmin [Halotydeus destructor]|nr:Endoplasmin [Halotydeus destructor]
MAKWTYWAMLALLGCCFLLITSPSIRADDDLEGEDVVIENNIGAGKEGSRTDDGVIAREEEAIKLDGINVAQMKELRESAEKHEFQAEVNRMMNLIINSLYRTKEIFLRELISNASDALDKIRVLALTVTDALAANEELSIRIKVDKENNMLHITDTGVGMTKEELISNLGTIAKSGTAEFLKKAGTGDMSNTEMNDLIGQFGVGFYSAFLVADRVVVSSKSNESPIQHLWESDSNTFTINEDPRGDTLKRGTQISLKLKDEAKDFLQEDKIRGLVEKYSQFINFPIYLWQSRVEEVEEPIDDEVTPEKAAEDEKTPEDEDDVKVEDAKEEKEKKTRKVEKTIWEWKLVNSAKPIWQRKVKDITDEEYDEFYKAITKDHQEPMAKTHFVAEGEVTFKSLLFIPKTQPSESFNKYGTKIDNIKLYVRRVFITDDFQDMLPNYLSFIRGVVDSDDLPLNVGRETLQQHKLLKVIKKKLVRKTLDMIKKISDEDYEKFWNEYSTNVKLGVIEDTANRSRLAKLLRFQTSALAAGKVTSLGDYLKRMADKQEHVYYIAAASYEEAAASPFVERLLKKGHEVLYLTDAVDEYCISALPEFDGKKFQNVAKDGLKVDSSEKGKERQEALQKEFEPLTKWLASDVLSDKVSKAVISERLHGSPCALVASQFGWTGNMERLARSNAHSKSKDVTRDYYLSQKKTLEINPRHPLIKELLRRVDADKEDDTAKTIANLMFETATLRSGYMLSDTASFAQRVEQLLRQNLGVDENATVEEEEEYEDEPRLDTGFEGEAVETAEEHDEL